MQKGYNIRGLILASLFAALTAIGAFIRIPTGISSITLQFFFTTLAGVLLGPLYGGLSQLIYVLLGLLGLPIFTAGGGFSYVLNPTFGFLMGLIPASVITGIIVGKEYNIKRVILSSVAGLGVLYLIGLPYMYFILNAYMGRGVTVSYVLYAGMLIFLPGDFLKILVVAIITKRIPKGLVAISKGSKNAR